MLQKSRIAWLLALALAVAVHAGAAFAQPYPSKPVRLIVGFPPGGGTDIMARLLAAKLPELLGQPFVVENRPGAATNIATEFVARSAPDGYTVMVTTSTVAINPAIYRKLPFDVLRDFAPVSIFSDSPNVLVVRAGLAAKSVDELIALARAKPGVLNYSSAGTGTTQHMTGELFKLRTGTDIVHVPFKGSGPSMSSLLAGDVDMTFANIPVILPQVRAGRLRALAVAGDKRSGLMPDVPTMKEAGVDGVEVTIWYGVLAPAATPREIVNVLADAVMKAARSPDIRQRLLDQGAEPIGNTPEEFAEALRAEVARWQQVVAASGIRAD
jgi:tripartite-type tricarboxylate transporter receptor subunit TctC